MMPSNSVREADEHYKKLLGLESGLPCHAMFEVLLHKIFGSILVMTAK